jgi:formylglycine-generating enzyme required for sulfatase activity
VREPGTGAERTDRIDELFQAALELPPGERRPYVEKVLAEDAEIGGAVARLLAAHERAEAAGFLDARGMTEDTATSLEAAGVLSPGDVVGRYRIVAPIGAGGMGEVFLAEDDTLARRVAVKLLSGPAAKHEDRVRRFRQEALAASALNHPNIITIYEVGEHGTTGFMATEFVEGRTLREIVAEGPMPLRAALDVALQVARALAAAHAAGIVHRDVKPDNVMVRPDGLVKVLDFGIAKFSDPTGGPVRTPAVQTRTGVVVGTTSYMSPEQTRGQETDARADIWAFGCVLYEMLSGRKAFGRETPSDTIAAILDRDPDWSALPDALPGAVRRLLQRCLMKDPAERLQVVDRARAELEEVITRSGAQAAAAPAAARPGRRTIAGAAAVLLVLAAAGGWWWRRDAGPRWARNVGVPELREKVEKEDYYGAFLLARKVQAHLPDDPAVRRFLTDQTFALAVESTPPGAEVSMKPYRDPDGPWVALGTTPLRGTRAPSGSLRLRIVKEGFEPLEIATDFRLRNRTVVLDRVGQAPKGMVHVPGGPFEFRSLPAIELGDFWLGRTEVTSREFKAFVDAGGYKDPSFWREPFVKDGRVLSWTEAMGLFRDTTGRPGPATWQLGSPQDGEADHPVAGVSWFEAAAYARFAGAALPTVHHWRKAAGMNWVADALVLSNFGGQGTTEAGSHQGLSPFGALDMAGNVKEWCWNASGPNRYILGGGWNEPSYMFSDSDGKPPWDRGPMNGFRVARYAAPPSAVQLAPVDPRTEFRDYARETPAPDAIFEVYRRFLTYDKTDLKATVESVEEAEHWRREKVSFEAAYGQERVPAYLYLPRNSRPPYQTIVFFPSGDALRLASSADLRMSQADFLLRSGRAVMYPVYKGTFERRVPSVGRRGAAETRDLLVQMSKDLGRAIDYLETRSDIDHGRLGFTGVSLGIFPLFLASETRLRAAALQGVGLEFWKPLPEVDPFHYAPRVTIPVLMLNGRNDFENPVQTSQRPLFERLGTPARDKRHVLFDAGHADFARHDVAREMLDWFDRYLGPVK